MKHVKYLAALLVCAGISNATIITPTSVTYTGTAPALTGAGLDDENGIINGSGLSATVTDANIGTVTHAGVDFAGNAWVTTDPGGFPSDFFASSSDTIIFEFDLGSVTTVGTIAVWGYHFGTFNDNSIANITLDFSTDSGSTTDSSQTVDTPFASAYDLASIVALTPTSANYITMTVNDNHFGSVYDNGGDRVGISEIAFSTVVIPEPATFGLVAMFGGILFIRRKLKT